MITVIGPVGPETWEGVPPRGAAMKPRAMAPQRPAIAPAPEVRPKAMASGRATTAVVMPPVRSPRQFFSQGWLQVRLSRQIFASGGSRNGERMLPPSALPRMPAMARLGGGGQDQQREAPELERGRGAIVSCTVMTPWHRLPS